MFEGMCDRELDELELRYLKERRDAKRLLRDATDRWRATGTPADRTWRLNLISMQEVLATRIQEIAIEKRERKRLRVATNIHFASTDQNNQWGAFVRAAKRVLPDHQYKLIWAYAVRNGVPRTRVEIDALNIDPVRDFVDVPESKE